MQLIRGNLLLFTKLLDPKFYSLFQVNHANNTSFLQISHTLRLTWETIRMELKMECNAKYCN